MSVIIPFDFHTHCTLSFDGESTAEEMVFRACELGMKHYALTDHIEIERFYDSEYNCDKTEEGARNILPELKERYKDRLDFIYGVELGQPMHDIKLTERLLSDNSYDFIIGSSHTLRGKEDFYFLDYSLPENEPHKLLKLYFEEILEMCKWGQFDVLGHLTYPLRYIIGDSGMSVDISRYNDIIDEIFRTLIENGKGIEINTSGLRQKIGVTLPSIGYIGRFRALGGEILSIGSDAHKTSDLGKGIEDGISLAKASGFNYVACFKNRKPEFIKI